MTSPPAAPPLPALQRPERHEKLSTSCRLAGRLDGAAQHLRTAIRLRWNQNGCKSFEDYFGKLISMQDEAQQERLRVAETLDSLGNVLRCMRISTRLSLSSDTGNVVKYSDKDLKMMDQEARTVIQLGLELRRYCLSLKPDSEELQVLVARSLSSLAMLSSVQGDQKLADKAHEEALELFSKVPSKAPYSASLRKSAFTARAMPTTNVTLHGIPAPPNLPRLLEKVEERPETEEDREMEQVEGGASRKPGREEEPPLPLDKEKFMEDEWEEFVKQRSKQQMEKKKNKLKVKLKLVSGHTGTSRTTAIANAAAAVAAAAMASSKNKQKRSSTGSATSITSSDYDLLRNGTDTGNSPCSMGLAKLICQTTFGKDDIANGEHIPGTIDLDPRKSDVITFGRLSKQEAGLNNSKTEKSSKRVYSYVQLDSAKHERLISRKHAQLKYTKIHRLLRTDRDEDLAHSPQRSTDGEADEQDSINTTNVRGRGGSVESDSGFSTASTGELEFEWSWVLRDLGSTNGLLVNGIRVREKPLQDGDIVSFGGASSVSFGGSITTHKRKPAFSVFVYEFKLDHRVAETRPSEAPMAVNLPPCPLPPTMLDRSVSSRLCKTLSNRVDTFIDQVNGSNENNRTRSNNPSSSSFKEQTGWNSCKVFDEAQQDDLAFLHFHLLFLAAQANIFGSNGVTAEQGKNKASSNANIFNTLNQREKQEQSARLYHRARVEGIPFTHWNTWIRATLTQERIDSY